jgi:hypothetical protein
MTAAVAATATATTTGGRGETGPGVRFEVLDDPFGPVVLETAAYTYARLIRGWYMPAGAGGMTPEEWDYERQWMTAALKELVALARLSAGLGPGWARRLILPVDEPARDGAGPGLSCGVECLPDAVLVRYPGRSTPEVVWQSAAAGPPRLPRGAPLFGVVRRAGRWAMPRDEPRCGGVGPRGPGMEDEKHQC